MPFRDSRAKWRRAHEHYEELQARIDAFFTNARYVVRAEPIGPGLYAIRAVNPPPLPVEHLSVVIGDCVHNARAALDYIAWSLAGANINDRETMFPIFETGAGWASERASRRRQRLSAEAVAFIEELQPFHAANPRTHALNGLRLLDDGDKHKLLTVVAIRPDNIELRWVGRTEEQVRMPAVIDVMPDVIVEDGAILATVTIQGAPEGMGVEAEFTPALAFGLDLGFGARNHVVDSLGTCLRAVAEIGGAAERRFP
jgi:hypothetical protein